MKALLLPIIPPEKRPPWLTLDVLPVTRRRMLAGILVIYGLSRLGLLPITFRTFVPQNIWGVLFLLLGILLWFTLPVPKFGIFISALAAGVCVGFAFDVGPWNTLAVLFYWLSVIAFIESGAGSSEC